MFSTLMVTGHHGKDFKDAALRDSTMMSFIRLTSECQAITSSSTTAQPGSTKAKVKNHDLDLESFLSCFLFC